HSFGYSINDADQVVGWSGDGTLVAHGFLWDKGKMQDLNDLVPTDSGWEIAQAAAINNSGQIACYGRNLGTGQQAILLLTPYILMLPPAPTAPSNLIVSDPTQTALTLNWKDNAVPSETPRDSTAEIGFEIDRSSAGKPYSRIATV